MSLKYLAMDEEGYWLANGARIADEAYGGDLLAKIYIEDHLFCTQSEEHKVIAECFDDPYVAKHVKKSSTLWTAQLPYSHHVQFNPASLSLDEWDRFHARAENGIPIVFSRSAQMELFDAFDEFDDDSITVNGKKIMLASHLPTQSHVAEPKFWSDIYQAWQEAGEKPGWDLNGPPKSLVSVLSQIKIPRSRIAVVGCGAGHDANYFYEQGHIVTGFDFSAEALNKARTLYPETDRRKFLQADALNLPQELLGQFDIVFEHTFYCAINPQKRNAAVRSYSRLLHEHGHLLGIFMIVDKMTGPPFGATEWELRERLKTNFQFLYWTRWRHSDEKRAGRELVVYAKKRNR